MMYENQRFIMMPFTRGLVKGNYATWWIDPDVTRHNSHGLFPQSNQALEEWLNSIGPANIVWAIMAKVDKLGAELDHLNHIGNVCLQSISWINRSAEFAIIIGEKDYWGQGYGEESLRFVLEHGFKKLGLNRIWTGTGSSNVGMQKLAERVGMVLEGRSRQGKYNEGKFMDIYHYGILAEEWNK
jgi:RimJ/RimL family protein N-acetyltransferase